jgi:hypothetical protein
MKTKLHHALIVSLLFALLGARLSTAFAQGTAFTYQGRLNSGGSPANGLYDFRFRLDADPAGNTILATLLTNAIPVTNGLFTTTIDFGGGFFNGSNYWLEVDVKTNNFATYTALNPLQQITPAPYAVFANTASNVSGTVTAAQINGAMSSANLSGTYVNAVTFNNAGNSFAGSGANLTSLNANNLSSGTVPLAQLPAVVVTNTETGVTLGGTFSGNGGGLTNLNAAQLTGAAASLSVTNLTLNGTLNLPAIVTIKAGGGKYLNSDALGNIFLGQGAGNPVVTGFNNVGFGENSLAANITGGNNTAIGYAALIYLGNLTSGIGGNDNIALGDSAGSNYQLNESGNIDIGSPGSEFENHTIHIGSSQTQAYIAGVINGNGGGLTNLNANNLSSGALPLAQLPAAVVTNNESGVTLHNATFSGTVNLPGIVTINDGGGKYLYSDGVGNFFLGQGAGNPAVSGFNNVSLGENALSAVTSGGDNTGLGYLALALNTQGNNNTASGYETLYNNTSGSTNTAIGDVALFSNTTGSGNTAIGESALNSNTNGNYNTAVGFAALELNKNGQNNTAIGYNALLSNRTGSNNIAIGYNAGFAPTGSSNIDIGNFGFTGEGNIIRIGTSQAATFIAGISGVTAASGVAVFVNSSGQLGTLTSSARFKRDIKSMDDASEAILALRPVTFKYKPELDAQGLPQFGLVAEEVDKVDPDLVARDDKNQIYTVRYEAVNAMLLNEFLKEHKTVEAQSTEIQQLKQSVAELKSMVEKLAVK